jgi:hypothetical protein
MSEWIRSQHDKSSVSVLRLRIGSAVDVLSIQE